MTDSDVITELDILDPETVWVSCECCGAFDTAADMVQQFDGSWLCGPCHWGYIREHEEQQRYLDRLGI